MVRRRSHRADTIDTSGQSTSDSSLEPTIPIASIVDPLEEGEYGWVGRCLASKIISEGLNGDVGMANNFATLKRLRSTVIGSVRVGEGARLEILDLDFEVEIGVSVNVLAWGGEGDDAGDHVGVGGNVTHD